MSIRFLLLLTALLSRPCYADQSGGGGDHVGNGGGFGEILTLTADRTLPAQLHTCLEKSDVCGLSAAQIPLLREFLARLPTLQKISVRFHPICGELSVSPESVLIPSCQLYEKGPEGSPLPGGALFLKALEARLMQAGLAAELLAPLAKLFERLQWSAVTSRATLTGGPVLLHFVSFGSGWWQMQNYLFAEGRDRTIDHTGAVIAALGCELPKDLRLIVNRADEYSAGQALFQGDLFWLCGREKFRARLSLVLSLEGDLQHLSLSRKEVIW